MKLFEVKTKNYKSYFVEANGYDEASAKVVEFLEKEESEKGVLDDDGSLRKKNEEDFEVKEIRVLADNIIR